MTAVPLLADRPLPPMPHPTPGNPFPSPMPPPSYQPACPTCGGPVASLLAGCSRRACLIADLDYDARFDNQDW
ncbi:hypothetical protein GCM10011608_09300 [Micromonospora sonchi]|uniref:Uncharacterized protein n=1 Tax=Micromonospora sonchi TaxID=1763543 RepID=A0A917WS32_9ACTN|nr:hypothetical protein [Micromonospora sonchi]GGM26619.1 hypothetical protein GCM10011608_09300 [Micromonospora sonchi]